MPDRRERRRSPVPGAILASLPNLVIVAGVVTYLATHHLIAPTSLSEVVPAVAVWWTWGVVAALIVTGALALAQSSLRAMRAEARLRLLTGFMLPIYAIALIATPDPSWLTGGLVLAAGVQQWARWWHLRAERMPERAAVGLLRGEEDDA